MGDENRILGSTLDGDMRRWKDAIALYSVIARLETDESDLLNKMVYGGVYAAFAEKLKAKLERERKRYKMFKDGKFQNPFAHDWGFKELLPKLLSLFTGSPHVDSQTGSLNVESQSVHEINDIDPPSALSIADALKYGNRKDSWKSFQSSISKILRKRDREYFQSMREQTVKELTRLRSCEDGVLRGQRLMYLLYMDLVDDHTANILHCKDIRDMRQSSE